MPWTRHAARTRGACVLDETAPRLPATKSTLTTLVITRAPGATARASAELDDVITSAASRGSSGRDFSS